MLPEVRTGLRRRVGHVHRNLWPIAQTTLAAAARPVVDDLARALEAAAQALADGDEELARRALALAGAVEDDLPVFFDAVTLARETIPCCRGAPRATACRSTPPPPSSWTPPCATRWS